MTETVALIVAAGRGVRAGGGIPKQYRQLRGVPLLKYSIEAFAEHPDIDTVRVVIHPDDGDLYAAASRGFDLLPPVDGGATRQESCRNGLESLTECDPARVLIHDAARPFIDAATIGRVVAALRQGAAAAIAAIPVADTLKRANSEQCVVDTVDRNGLWRAQTPQGFRFDEILQAHRRAAASDAGSALTDDAAVAEAAGLTVTLVDGDPDNVKVTMADDFSRAERYLAAREGTAPAPGIEFRTGSGIDVHPFTEGDHVMLCGCRIPHDRGLAGHSDSDVGLHALTDALLGTIGAGDIGSHFPPSDPQWRGADSAVFLAHAAALVAAQGGAVRHVDETLIGEAPKIGPHREALRARLAELLSLEVARISVKATTTDGLGFLGRGEGIAVQAVVTVRF